MTIQIVEGKVAKINKGPKAYSALIDEVWYGCGFDVPTFKEGDTIKAAYVTNGRWKNLDGDVSVVANAAPAPKETPTPVARSRAQTMSAGNKDNYWENKAAQDLKTQKEIRLQASRNAAIAFIPVLLNSDALKLPTKQADKVGFLEELLQYYTDEFYKATVAVNEPVAKGKSDKPVVEGAVEETQNYE